LFGYGPIAAACGGIVGGLGPVLGSIGNEVTGPVVGFAETHPQVIGLTAVVLAAAGLAVTTGGVGILINAPIASGAGTAL
jgi:hypothetical protein